MTIGRRHPPNIPSEAELKGPEAAKHIRRLWEYVKNAFAGLATPHAETHLPSGADPLTTGTPVSIGLTASAGDDEAYSLSDHVHSTPLTTKGDLLTVSGGALAKLGVGTDTHILTADSAQAAGIKWAANAAAAADAEYVVAVAHAGLSAERVTTDTATVAWDHTTPAQAKANVPNDAITYAKLQNVAGFSVVGKATTGSGDAADITAADETVLGRTAAGNVAFAALATGQVANDAITYAKLQNVAGFSVVAKATTGSGDAADVTAADETVLGRTGGGNLGFASLATGQITNAAVTYAKIQDVSAASRLLGRGSAAGSGDVEEISPGNSVAITTTTLDTIQDIRTTATPQFARLGLGAAADATDVLKMLGGAFHQETASNGAVWQRGYSTELVTVAAAATTDSSTNLLPANSIIEAVLIRVTVAIPTAATFNVGTNPLGGDATRFATGVSVAVDTTAVGLNHWKGSVNTEASGPSQTVAAVIRITPNAVPANNNGRVRLTVFYRTFTPPTS